MAGAGALNLPQALVQTGWSGLILIIVIGTGVAYSSSRLGASWSAIQETWPNFSDRSTRRPYSAIGEKAFGKVGRCVIEIFLNVNLLGTSIVYQILTSQLTHHLLQIWTPGISQCHWIIIFGLVLLPTTLFGSLKDLWLFSVIAVLSTSVSVLVVIIIIINQALQAPQIIQAPSTTSNVITLKSYLLGYGGIIYSYGGAASFPSIQVDMKDSRLFSYSVLLAFSYMIVLYVPVAGISYSLLGAKIESNILLSVEGMAVTVAEIMMLSHFLFVFSVVLNPVMQNIEHRLGIPKAFCWQRFVVRALTICLTTLVSLSIPWFGKILDLLGGSTVTCMTFVFPPVLYLRLASLKKDNRPIRSVSTTEKNILLFVAIIGFTGGVSTTVNAIQEIISPEALGNSCFAVTSHWLNISSNYSNPRM